MQAVARLEANAPRAVAEEHRADLRVGVLQREVGVPRAVDLEVGDLAFHPHVPVFALKMRAHCGDQIADDPYTAIGRFEGKPKLINERHFDECTVRL